jgi:hypothetical protein
MEKTTARQITRDQSNDPAGNNLDGDRRTAQLGGDGRYFGYHVTAHPADPARVERHGMSA